MKSFMALAPCAVLLTAGIQAGNATPPGKTPTAAQLQKAFPNASSNVFEAGQVFTVFWIDPRPRGQRSGGFDGYPVRRERVVSDPRLKAELRAAINDAIASNNGVAAKCFIPHHGLRVSQGSQTVDLVICFGCRRLAVYSGQTSSSSIIAAKPGTEALFDRALK